MSNQKHLTGWYVSDEGTVFHALTEGGMSQETLEAMGKMADVARKMQAADDAAAYQAMADDPTVDQAAWRELADKAKAELDSMSDLMGHWVPREQIEQVLAVCRETPQHQYQLLTKNAPRLLQFEFPDNVWVGVSAPPSEMMGKRLSVQQQSAMVRRQWEVMARVKAKIRWMSIEPLSFDIVGDFYGTGLSHKPPFEWFVIGAASNGRTIYQPHPAWVGGVVGYADLLHIPVFFKGNLRGNAAVATLGWRNAFPEVKDG